MAIPNSTWTEILSTTLSDYSPQLADNITNHNPLLYRLKQRGNNKPTSGGASIVEGLMYAENSTVKWYAGYEELSVAASDTLTSAEFEWKQLNANVTISGEEMLKNSGSKHQVHDLLESRIKVAEQTMENTVAAALFFSNTENDGKSIGGLQHLVADAGAGTVGGIDSSAQTWWKNQFYDFSDDSTTASSSTIVHALNQAYIQSVRNNDKPDLGVFGQTYYTFYEEAIQDKQRFTKNDMADAGFLSIMYKDVPIVYDSNCGATRGYLLNTKYIHFKPSSAHNFVQDDRRVPINQDAVAIPFYWKGNMTVSNRSLQAVIVP